MPWGDPQILEELLRQTARIRDPRVRRVVRRAGVETGLVESGGRNLRGGDADSAGWRQERRSLYRNPRNVRASVGRFISEALKAYDPGEHSYQVAAQVQRPRADLRGRYHDVAGEASAILRRSGGAIGGGGASPGRGAANPLLGMLGAAAGPGARTLPQGSEGLLPLIEALSGPRRGSGTPSSGLPMPSFAAGPVFGGQQPVTGSGGPQRRPEIAALLSAVGGGGADVQHAGIAGVQTPIFGAGGGRAGGLAGARGKARVSVAPGADRAGVRTKPAVLNFLAQVSRISGRRVRLGTGTKHSRMTVNGNVSQHWTGDAGDVPATGRRLVELGQAALIAAGMSPRKARRQRGGLYNVNGYQIIFNTHQGGDHTNHLHVGI